GGEPVNLSRSYRWLFRTCGRQLGGSLWCRGTRAPFRHQVRNAEGTPEAGLSWWPLQRRWGLAFSAGYRRRPRRPITVIIASTGWGTSVPNRGGITRTGGKAAQRGPKR